MNRYDKGDLVRCEGTFKNAAGTNIDPGAIYLQTMNPSGTIVILQYSVDAALKRDSVGVYYAEVDADAHGVWRYRFYSTGTGQAAGETSFRVSDSQFD